MLGLYKFYWDCGRMGFIDGLFITESGKAKNIVGREVYFGEVLGKHSEIFGTIEEGDISVVSENEDLIEHLRNTFGSDTLSGYNPITRREEQDADEEYENDEG